MIQNEITSWLSCAGLKQIDLHQLKQEFGRSAQHIVHAGE